MVYFAFTYFDFLVTPVLEALCLVFEGMLRAEVLCFPGGGGVFHCWPILSVWE